MCPTSVWGHHEKAEPSLDPFGLGPCSRRSPWGPRGEARHQGLLGEVLEEVRGSSYNSNRLSCPLKEQGSVPLKSPWDCRLLGGRG